MTAGPSLTGLRGVYCAVDEFGPTVRVFREGLGWSVVDFDDVDAVEAGALWGIDAPVQIMTLAPHVDCPTGLVHLFLLPAHLTPARRGAPALGDYGDYAISVQARDAEEVIARSVAAGARLRGEALAWELTKAGKPLYLSGATLELPADLNVQLTQSSDPRPTWAWAQLPDAPTTELTFLVRTDPDHEAAVRLWGESGLGLPQANHLHLTDDLVAVLGGIAPGLDIFNDVLGGAETTRVELLGPNGDTAGLPAGVVPDWRPRQAPGLGLGQVMWRAVLPERPASFARWAQERGVTISVLPVRRTSAHFAGRTVGIVEGPTGQRVQLEIPGA